MPNALSQLASQSNAWPFVEAKELITRLEGLGVADDPNYEVIFETGYGPSGLPHIGTFAEVVRTSMVRHAYTTLTGRQAKLICFSDDMDGLRKVPDNVPNPESLAKHLDKPLTSVPDPFGEAESFAAHNNDRLRAFLDAFGFDYEFLSATECYQSGMFDATLLKVLAAYDKIKSVVLPTLGEERQATYSPFLPICPKSGKVLQVAITAIDSEAGTIGYTDPDTGEAMTTQVTGGRAKLQWKCDWAMRWVALGVDYEMSGKDLDESVKLSSKIARILGGTPPVGFSYELFLDHKGEKISKSLGNGLSVDEWLAYGTEESLALFMYQHPRRAKRLYFDVVPKMVDMYYAQLAKWQSEDDKARLENPIWHIHQLGKINDNPPAVNLPIEFSSLLSLASVYHAEDDFDSRKMLWDHIANGDPDASPTTQPELARLMKYAIRYFQDKVKRSLSYRKPSTQEIRHLKTLIVRLQQLPPDADKNTIQTAVFDVGKAADYESIKDWFTCLYETLLGQKQGPRMGSFIKSYGIAESIVLIEDAIDGTLEAIGDVSPRVIDRLDKIYAKK